MFGTEGRIEIEIPFNAPPDKPTRIWKQKGENIEEITFEICNQYTIQGDLFSKAVINNTDVPTPLEDSLNNMRVIEAIIKSSQNDTW